MYRPCLILYIHFQSELSSKYFKSRNKLTETLLLILTKVPYLHNYLFCPFFISRDILLFHVLLCWEALIFQLKHNLMYYKRIWPVKVIRMLKAVIINNKINVLQTYTWTLCSTSS